ncbi:MAG: helix-turn-helix domain-containing protein [Flavobacteriales bacterium AspAUS03]
MVSRIEKIMLDHGLSPAAFADKIGVTRSNVSHIFSGRNKPSLEIILKIHTAFPEINLDWLLTGKENPTEILKSISSSLPFEDHEILEHSQAVERIVVFFEDGMFRSYTPRVEDKYRGST